MGGMEPSGESSESRSDALRKGLGAEYAAIVKVVSEFDGRRMIVKGWSVTLTSISPVWSLDSKKATTLCSLSRPAVRWRFGPLMAR